VYVNRKMRPVETVLGMGEEWIKKNDVGGEFKYDILLRTFVNACHNVPPVQQ
jgi:hypothetical protein